MVRDSAHRLERNPAAVLYQEEGVDAMKVMNELPAWVRLRANSQQELDDLARMHTLTLTEESALHAEGVLRMRCPRLDGSRLLVTELWWVQRDDQTPLYTVETAYGELWAGQARAWLQSQGLALDSAHATALAFLRQLAQQTATVLDAIDARLSVAGRANARLLRNAGTDRAGGIEDVEDLGVYLSTLNIPLSLVVQSLEDLERAARQLRRAVLRQSSLTVDRVDELIAEIERVQRRVHFLLDRQRFHQRTAQEVVAMSDLNVVKVFTVLWAIFVPGTALINWYGQNFRFMPELSWFASSWVQMLGVLLVTAVPVLIISKAGALR
jgi:magnesium transporter